MGMEIQGYPNYLIYEDGKVCSKKSNRVLKPYINHGYLQITLSNNGKQKFDSVDQIVIKQYIIYQIQKINLV